MDLLAINKKLIGPIGSVGETNTDNERFENLKVMCDLAETLLSEIDNKSTSYANPHQYSIQRNQQYGIDFLNRIGFRNDHNENIS